jgi:hypothetical protein
MASKGRTKHLTRNQKLVAKANTGVGTKNLEEDARRGVQREDFVSFQDIFLNFRASSMNRAKDIRDFAAGCDSFDLGNEDLWQLKKMTENLHEQYAYLMDAWDTLLRCVQEHAIDVNKDEAFIDMKSAMEHTTRVVDMAIQMSDQFQLTNTEDNTDNVVLTAEEEATNNNEAQKEETAGVIEAENANEHYVANVVVNTEDDTSYAILIAEEGATNNDDSERTNEAARITETRRENAHMTKSMDNDMGKEIVQEDGEKRKTTFSICCSARDRS